MSDPTDNLRTLRKLAALPIVIPPQKRSFAWSQLERTEFFDETVADKRRSPAAMDY